MSPVESIERATVGAVAPLEALEIGGWLVALDPGTIRRAGSAVPLSHDLAPDAGVLNAIEAAYAERALAPAFRIADAPGLQSVREELTRRGYRPEQPTLVKIGSTAGMIAAARGEPAAVAAAPDAGWARVFTSEGFDPTDGASRVAALTRSPDAVYGGLAEDGHTLAVGVAAFGHGWASVHGMRTDKARRGEGLAGRVLAGLAHAAQARGIEQVFLQVEEANEGARSLYRRCGFQRAWRYLYWSKG